jgi:hypothetical protein
MPRLLVLPHPRLQGRLHLHGGDDGMSVTTRGGLTSEREQEIREQQYRHRSMAAADIAVDDLLDELDRLRAELAESTVEYGIDGLPADHIADRTYSAFAAKARLTSYQQSWLGAHLVTRTVRHSAWTPAQDGGQP